MKLSDERAALIEAIIILRAANDKCLNSHSVWSYFREAFLGYKCAFTITHNATVYLLQQARDLIETEAVR